MERGVTSAVERRHIQAVVDLGCVLCRRLGYPGSPAQFHHIRVNQAGGQKSSTLLGIPLCLSHHTGLHGIHGDRADFRNASVDELQLLADVIKLLFYE